MNEARIDLNADLGENPLAGAIDNELMRCITSANIACGGHAGDRNSVRSAIVAARALGVNVGAHPSYPDRENFGRRAMEMAPAELEESLLMQIRLVADVASDCGVAVTHVKPHGALYHAVNTNLNVAHPLARAVRAANASITLVVQYGSPAVPFLRKEGLTVATEAFVDRAYEPDGSLRDRSREDAVLDEDRAIQQALGIVLDHRVIASDGSEFAISPDTLCFHSDTPNALSIARQVKRALEQAGIRITPMQSSTR